MTVITVQPVLDIPVAWFYACLVDVLMTALDFEHSSLGKHKPLISALKIGWQAEACVAIARA